MSLIEDQETPLWQKLYKLWLKERKPGVIVLNGAHYKVLRPDDENVKFVPQGGFDTMYGSQSKGLGNE